MFGYNAKICPLMVEKLNKKESLPSGLSVAASYGAHKFLDLSL